MNNRPRPVQTVEAAIFAVLAEFSDDEIKDITGKSAALLRKWADDQCEYNHFPFYQAVNLAAALKKRGIQERFSEALKVLIDRKVSMMGGIPAHCPAHPSDRIMDIFVEAGDVAREIQNAVNPSGQKGREISLAEKNLIAKEAYELRDAIDLLLKDIGAAE